MYYFYLARCNDWSLYAWSCKDIEATEIRHNKWEWAKFTKQRRPVKIIYSEEFETLLEARNKEAQIKWWTRVKKENLIKYWHPTKF